MAGHTGADDIASAALDDSAPRVRVAALRSLDRLGVISTSNLDVALADPDFSVRITALELAAKRDQPAIEHLLNDSHPMVVESAAWALGERPDPSPATIDGLIDHSRNHDDALVREACVAALGALGDERGLPAILAATTDKPAVRRRAVIALVAFEGPEVEAAWDRARTDKDRQVRDAVEELLGPVDP